MREGISGDFFFRQVLSVDKELKIVHFRAFLDSGYDSEAALALYPFHAANAPQISIGPNPSKWTDAVRLLVRRSLAFSGLKHLSPSCPSVR